MNKQVITENENYESDDYIISLVDIIKFLKESRHNVGWALLGTVGLAIAYLISATPMYTASAVLIIHGKSQNNAILSNLDGQPRLATGIYRVKLNHPKPKHLT